jgi:hypothetical protein
VYDRLGKQVVRSLPWQFKDPNTISQQSQRQKYMAAQGFVKLFTQYLKQFWTNLPVNQTAWNNANQYCILKSMQDVGGIWSVDMSLSKVTQGLLLPSRVINFYSYYTNGVYCTQIDNSGTGNALATDLLWFFYYFPEINRIYTYQSTEIFRNRSSAVYFFPDNVIGKVCHAWAFWVRSDLSIISDSFYMGSTIIIP